MDTVSTKAGAYRIYLGREALRKLDEHQPDKWYFEPATYVGFTIFSDAYDTPEEARKVALDTGDREERLGNEIGGGG